MLRRTTLRRHQPSTCFLAPTGSINLGFLLRETCFYTHHTFHLGFPTDVCFTRITKFWCWGLIRRLGLQLLGASTYIMRSKGRGPATPSHTLAAPLEAGAPLSPNPSRFSSSTSPAAHRRSPAGDLHHHRHHAVVLSGFRGGSTTSAARCNGEKDVVINTERVTEYGGAARLWHRQDLLRAFESGK